MVELLVDEGKSPDDEGLLVGFHFQALDNESAERLELFEDEEEEEEEFE